MFVPPPHAALTERQQQQSRGYVLGLILLVLFLSSQDFSPPSRRRVEAAHGQREGLVKHREDVKDKIIVDLSSSNELLERENRWLKVAAIGLMGELRDLGKVETAERYNLTGLGVYAGHDAEDGDDEMSVGKQSDIDRKKKVAHVDDGMLKRDERAGGDAENDSGVVKVRRALRF